jgi:hypothetical protein
MVTDRFGNLGLNAAILLLGLVMVLLGWSLVGGWFGGDPRAADDAASHEIVQLEVRNGCGTSGLAARAAEWLRGEGVDVLEAGDWTRFDVRETYVIDRIGDSVPAREVLRLLELDPGRIREDVRSDYYLDATLVIGCDYESLPPFRE